MAEHTSDPDPASSSDARRGRQWVILVPVVAAVAGLLFTTTARTAAGARLRDDRRPELSRVIAERKAQVTDESALALHGPGLVVVLDDAPRRAGGALPAGARPDDPVVHQQDVQSVVDALWAGRAEAMVVMNMRMISTSDVRCVGNTLLLRGQVFSPPFEIRAIGDAARLRGTLESDPGVRAFRDAADAYHLGYSVQNQDDIVAPAHVGPVSLDHASALR